MAKACKDCKGRGRWQEATYIAHGLMGGSTELVWCECQTCSGSGVEQDPEAGDNYDIGGDSYADADD